MIPYPVLRDGDALVPDAPDAGRRRRPPPRPLLDRRRRPREPADGGLDGDLSTALRREWHEELDVDFVPDFRFVGLLNDDTTAVGQVHLGLVYEADAAGRPVAIRETEKLSGAFVGSADVAGGRRRPRDVEPARLRIPRSAARRYDDPQEVRR